MMVPAGKTSSGAALVPEMPGIIACRPGGGIRGPEGTPGTGRRGLMAGAFVDAAGATGLAGKIGRLGTGAGTATAGVISVIFVEGAFVRTAFAFVEAEFVETFNAELAGWPNARLSNSVWLAFVDWAGKGANTAPSAASALLRFGPRRLTTAGVWASAPRHVRRRKRNVFTLFID